MLQQCTEAVLPYPDEKHMSGTLPMHCACLVAAIWLEFYGCTEKLIENPA